MNKPLTSVWDPVQFGRRMETRYVIRNRDTGAMEFFGAAMRRAPAQAAYLRWLIGNIRRGPVRAIVGKARRGGISSSTEAVIYDVTTTVPNMHGAVLAHKDESTSVLFDYVRQFYNNTDAQLRPRIAERRGMRWVFGSKTIEEREEEIGLRSSIECATAGGNSPFSGASPGIIHWSEVAKTAVGNLNRQVEIQTSTLNALVWPNIAVWESTAQGMGNLFHLTWLQAQKNIENGRVPQPGEWVPFFIAAQDDPLNRMAVEPHYNWHDWPSEDIDRERRLVERHGATTITPEFLRWRRMKVQEMRGDTEKFNEDYPTSWDVMFLGGGRPAIPRYLTDAAERFVKQPMARYTTRLEQSDAAYGSEAVVGWN